MASVKLQNEYNNFYLGDICGGLFVLVLTNLHFCFVMIY